MFDVVLPRGAVREPSQIGQGDAVPETGLINGISR
jgi:hypothetical protein